MKLILGLGNPGRQYAQTRHNAGFMTIDRLARRHEPGTGGTRRSRFHAEVLETTISGQRCLLLKPMTYMNQSGIAVREAIGFYKLESSDMLVVVDDVALPAGAIRLRAAGSAGGHNGLIDIESALGSPQYARLRIGIDPPGQIPQSDYVLGRFTTAQLEAVEPAIDRACDTVEAWLLEPIEQVMSRFN